MTAVDLLQADRPVLLRWFIAARALLESIPLAPIRAALRTGDTPQWERQQMIREDESGIVNLGEPAFCRADANRGAERQGIARGKF